MFFSAIRKAREQLKSRKPTIRFDSLKGDDLSAVREMAEMAAEIWHDHYDPIIGGDQVNYMIDRFQSEKAITEQISHGYVYYSVVATERKVGFFAYYPREDALYLSKLYLCRSERGKGYSRAILGYLIDQARQLGLPAIELNVNKYNASSIAVYERLGFVRIRGERIDIGSGYYMDDYVYRLEVGA